MERKVVGVFHNPWREDYDPQRSLAELYRRAVWLKANPRREDYMRALFDERYPAATYVNADRERDWAQAVADADTIVMLYPDATGLYFSGFEHRVRREMKGWATLRVLNGRRRDFVLSGRVRRALRVRRFLERTMLGEVLAIVIFAAASPVFVLSDLVRGRR